MKEGTLAARARQAQWDRIHQPGEPQLTLEDVRHQLARPLGWRPRNRAERRQMLRVVANRHARHQG